MGSLASGWPSCRRMENRLLDVAGHLRLAPGVVLPGQAQLQRGNRQVVVPLVGSPVWAAPPNDHGHMGQPLGVFVLEEGLSQLGDMVLAVGLQAPHQQLAGAAPRQDVIVRPVPNERLGLVELAVRRAPPGDAVVELPGAGQLPVGAGQQHGLQAVVPQG